MTRHHVLLAALMIILWGLNFICIKMALQDLPTFLLVFLRFFFSTFPFIFFLPRPKGKWKDLFFYGIFTFALQYIFLFYAMKIGAPAGLSSLLIQIQVFFTLILSAFIFKEKIALQKWIGVIVAFLGILELALYLKGELTNIQLLFILLAAFSWGFGNIFSKKLKIKNPLALVVWGSACALPFLLISTLLNDGPELIFESLKISHFKTILSVVYIVYVSTLICFSIWGFLLSKYKSSDIAPLTLLVPIVGFISSFIVFDEHFTTPKIIASLLIFIGLYLSVVSKKVVHKNLKRRFFDKFK